MMFAPYMTRAQFRLYSRRRRHLLEWRHRITVCIGAVALGVLLSTVWPW